MDNFPRPKLSASVGHSPSELALQNVMANSPLGLAAVGAVVAVTCAKYLSPSDAANHPLHI